MLTHHNSVTGVPVCPYYAFHGSRSAVSSATLSQCLAPNDISLKTKAFAYYSASLRFKLLCIITREDVFVKGLCGEFLTTKGTTTLWQSFLDKNLVVPESLLIY